MLFSAQYFRLTKEDSIHADQKCIELSLKFKDLEEYDRDTHPKSLVWNLEHMDKFHFGTEEKI